MKKWIIISCLLFLYISLQAQNTFPSSGNVGIGITAPHAPLHVIGGTQMNGGWNKTSMLEAVFPVQVFNSNNIKWGGVGYDYSTGMRFWVNSSNSDVAGNGLIGMTIFNTGIIDVNVAMGIGTSNPKAKLDVLGTAYFNNPAGQDYAAIAVGASGGGYGTVGYGYRFTQTSGVHTYANNDYSSQISFASGGMTFKTAPIGSKDAFVDYKDVMRIQADGKIGIGTNDPTELLSVNGNVRTKKLIVSQTGWPDYVFDSSYSLRSLSEVEKFIAKNKYLPEMPSAKEVEEKGVSVGDNQALLLKKIEELTLYMISMQKEILLLKSDNQQLKKLLKKHEK